MLAYNKCPGCGLRMGQRKEPTGNLYRCRKCKAAIIHVSKDKSGDSLFSLRRDAERHLDLLTIPRV